MENGRCDAIKCIKKFENLVIRTWDQKLNERSFIHRKDRKTIRNVFRAFIYYSCQEEKIQGIQEQLLYPSLKNNYFIVEFLKYNHQAIKKLYSKVDTSAAKLPDLSTKGKYIIYCVIYLLFMGNEDTTFQRIDGPQDASKKISDIIVHYFASVSWAHYKYKCKYMFIGIPSYYVSLISADDTLFVVKRLPEVTKSYTYNDRYCVRLSDPEMRAYQDFVNFIIASKKCKTKTLKLSFCGISFETDYSVSEMAMEGLCYCYTDDIFLTPGSYEFAQVFTHCLGSNSYEYIRLTDIRPATKMSYSNVCGYDCSAIRIAKDKNNDFYQNRRSLFFPDNCNEWKWYLDEDDHACYDYARDKERSSSDYEGRIPEDVFQRNCPLRNFYKSIMYQEREKENVYSEHKTSSFEQEMVDAMLKDNYTPSSIKKHKTNHNEEQPMPKRDENNNIISREVINNDEDLKKNTEQTDNDERLLWF